MAWILCSLIFTTVHITEIQLRGSRQLLPVIFQPTNCIPSSLYCNNLKLPVLADTSLSFWCPTRVQIFVPSLRPPYFAVLIFTFFHSCIISVLLFLSMHYRVRQRVPAVHEMDYGHAVCSTCRQHQ